MNTKIVYAVVSNEKDVYLEQTLVSVYSLRLYNPQAHVILAIDEDTDKTIQGKRSEILKYVTEKTVIKVPNKYTQIQRSRYLKTTLRQHIIGDFLFIDSDTIITSSLEDIDTFTGEIGAVLDKHLYIKEHPARKNIHQWAKQIGWEITENTPQYYNSGVFYVKDTPTTHEFYCRWNSFWTEGCKNKLNLDQPSLGKTYSTMPIIKELGGVWNCQILENGLKYLYKAKIIHYFSSCHNDLSYESPYLFLDKQLFMKIKESGQISQEIVAMIKEAKTAFSLHYQIYTGRNLQFFSTYPYFFLKKLYYNYPSLYMCMDKFLSAIGKIKRKLIILNSLKW